MHVDCFCGRSFVAFSFFVAVLTATSATLGLALANPPPQLGIATAAEDQPSKEFREASDKTRAAEEAFEKALAAWEEDFNNQSKREDLRKKRQELSAARQEIDRIRDKERNTQRHQLEELAKTLHDAIDDGSPEAPGAAGAAAAAAANMDRTGLIEKRRVHLLLFATGDDGNQTGSIVSGAQSNRRNIRVLFKGMCGNRLNIVADEASFDEKTIAARISTVSAAPDDAVVCYIATHGVFLGEQHWLSSSPGNNADIRRAKVFESLRSRNAGLSVLISDACGSIAGFGAKAGPETPGLPPEWPLWHLIFKTRGTVNINAATRDRIAIFFQNGGLFTRSLLTQAVYGKPITQNDINDGSAWDKFFGRVSQSAMKNAPVQVTWRDGHVTTETQPPACKLSADGRLEYTYK